MDNFVNEYLPDKTVAEHENVTRNDKNVDHSHPENWKLNCSQKDVENMKDDPFCRILEHIFAKLSPKDLINASLVSKNWYNLIGKLETFNRLKLTYFTNNYDSKTDEYIYAIKNSTRIYENISINLWNHEKDIKIAEQIIFKYSGFLKCLKLIKFGGFNTMLNESIDMPIEELEVQVSCGRLSWKFFENVTTLKKLIINGIEPIGLDKCLNKNTNLKELTFYENSFISYFTQDISKNIKFQLRTLKILDHNNQPNMRLNGEFNANFWSENQRSNFFKLLLTQNSLKALHLDVCYAEDFDIILTIPTLKLLEINKVIGNFPDHIMFSNIKSFITSTDEMDFTMIEKILIYLPKLESLYIHQLSIEIFFRLLGYQYLRNFHYFWASEEDYGHLICLKAYYSGSIYVTRSTKNEFINLFG